MAEAEKSDVKGTLRVVVVPVDGEPYVKKLEPDESGSFLHALQSCVAIGGEPGLIEPMSWVFDDSPTVYCNEEGKLRGGFEDVNRAIYATDEMVAEGVGAHAGDLLDVAFGPLVCAGYDPETGDHRDVTDEEVERVEERFGGPESVTSGKRAVLSILARREAEASEAPSRREGRSGARSSDRARGQAHKGASAAARSSRHARAGRTRRGPSHPSP